METDIGLYLVRKVHNYDDHVVNIKNKCIANNIIDLCRHRCNSFHCANIASHSELNDMLKILCTDYLNIVMLPSK